MAIKETFKITYPFYNLGHLFGLVLNSLIFLTFLQSNPINTETGEAKQSVPIKGVSA